MSNEYPEYIELSASGLQDVLGDTPGIQYCTFEEERPVFLVRKKNSEVCAIGTTKAAHAMKDTIHVLYSFNDAVVSHFTEL
jgi:hypothetical protein